LTGPNPTPAEPDGRSAPPVLVVVAGEVASGKSTVARALADRIGAETIEGDRVRDEMLGNVADQAALWDAFTPEFEVRVYEEVLRRAGQRLASGRRVILDGCFPQTVRRISARAAARRFGAPFLYVDCVASPDVIRRRIEERDAAGSHPGWAWIHDRVEAHREPLTGVEPDEVRRVDCDGAVEDCIAEVLTAPCLRAPTLHRPEAGPPRAVTFDCWNTLLYEADWEKTHALRVAELGTAAREAGWSGAPEAVRGAFDRAWERHMALWRDGVATGAHEVAVWSLAELGVSDPEPPAFAHLLQMFEEMSHSSRVLPLEGARETLAALSLADVPCALICDTGLTPGRVVRKHLESHGLLEALPVQIFSDEAGVPKPDPRVFRKALEALGVGPDGSVHVGDLRRTDVSGARSIGMTTVRIRDRHDDVTPLPEADRVVASHAELVDCLGLGPVRGR
jgi:putative hydrolase of the HAD superfamily